LIAVVVILFLSSRDAAEAVAVCKLTSRQFIEQYGQTRRWGGSGWSGGGSAAVEVEVDLWWRFGGGGDFGGGGAGGSW